MNDGYITVICLRCHIPVGFYRPWEVPESKTCQVCGFAVTQIGADDGYC